MGELCYTTIRNRIVAGEFENKLPYPLEETLKKHEKHQFFTKQMLELQARIQVLTSDRSMLVSNMRRAHTAEEVALKTKFKEALETVYGLQNHPKRDGIWLKAWDTGHSSGLTEVLSEYDEIAALVV